MKRKLERAVAELEKRTNTKMGICEYDDVQSGVQSMSDGNKYALWLYAVKRANGEYMSVGTKGKVIGRFQTQAEAIDEINAGVFDKI